MEAIFCDEARLAARLDARRPFSLWAAVALAWRDAQPNNPPG
jgi:hypothetical protein